ncbi:MAG: hypothetical protein ACLFUE_07520, partial [Desulfobacteraceae bacterium]
MANNGTNQKICPFLQQQCVAEDCALFNSRFQRCDIGLLVFNLYRFADSIKSLESIMDASRGTARREDSCTGTEGL